MVLSSMGNLGGISVFLHLGRGNVTGLRLPTPGIPRDLLTQSQGELELPPAVGPLLTQVSPQSSLRREAGALPPHAPTFHLY